MHDIEAGLHLALGIYTAGKHGLPMPDHRRARKEDAQILYSAGVEARLDEINGAVAADSGTLAASGSLATSKGDMEIGFAFILAAAFLGLTLLVASYFDE